MGRSAEGRPGRLGSGHCPENSASDSPLIKPPLPPLCLPYNPLNNGGEEVANRVRRADKRDPWARLAGDHTAARATASTAPLLAIVLVISDSRCPQSQTPPSSPPVLLGSSARGTVRVTYH